MGCGISTDASSYSDGSQPMDLWTIRGNPFTFKAVDCLVNLDLWHFLEMPGKNSDSSMILVNGNEIKAKLARRLSSVAPEIRTTDRISKCTCASSFTFVPKARKQSESYIQALSVPEEQVTGSWSLIGCWSSLPGSWHA